MSSKYAFEHFLSNKGVKYGIVVKAYNKDFGTTHKTWHDLYYCDKLKDFQAFANWFNKKATTGEFITNGFKFRT